MNDEMDPLAAELRKLQKDDQRRADDRESIENETDLLALYFKRLKEKGVPVQEAKTLMRRYQSYLWGWNPGPDDE